MSPHLQVKICDFGLSRQLATACATKVAADCRCSAHCSNRELSTSIASEGCYSSDSENVPPVQDCSHSRDWSVASCSREHEDDNEEPMTPYVVTRWYRAPEVMLTNGMYDSAQDVWAAACTFAEFVTRKPLFPGKCSMDQLRLIVRGLGKPGPRDVSFSGITTRGAAFLLQQQGPPKRQGLAHLLSPSSVKRVQVPFVQLLRGMLHYNPRHRLTCTLALSLPLFNEQDNRIDSGNTPNIPATMHAPALTPDPAPSLILRVCQSHEHALPHRILDMRDIERCPNERSALQHLLVLETCRVQQELATEMATEPHAVSAADREGAGAIETIKIENRLSPVESLLTRSSGNTSSAASTASLDSLSEQGEIDSASSATIDGAKYTSPCLDVQDAPGVKNFVSPSVHAASAAAHNRRPEGTTVDTVATPEVSNHKPKISGTPTTTSALHARTGLLASMGRLVGSMAHGTKSALRRSLRKLDGFK